MIRHMRLIIFGSRQFTNYALLRDWADRLTLRAWDVTVLSGHAAGADLLGERYARERWLTVEVYHADWNKHGKAAGPLRNEEMCQASPTHALGFWVGRSRGTADMIERCQRHGIKLKIIEI